jgi:hypothetical protein
MLREKIVMKRLETAFIGLVLLGTALALCHYVTSAEKARQGLETLAREIYHV